MTIRPARLAVTIAAALVCVAALALVAGAGTTPTGGVRGLVKVPVTGTCPSEEPCDGIGRGIQLVFWQTGRKAHSVRSNVQGAFRILLAPGRYRVRAVVTPAQPITPVTVVVPARGFVRTTFLVGAQKHVVPPPPPPPLQG